MLIDRATIFVMSGKGGDGCISLRREKYVPKGGPDGGDGGRGGSVVLVGDDSLDTLLGLKYSPHFKAAKGGPGRGKSMHGADADDRLVLVPLGTIVFDQAGETVLGDISEQNQRLVVAKGGRGGFGNEHFKSATNQTPRDATPGEPGEEWMLRLELKLIADVGLVGKPNAGKSTLLRAVSQATPKVADYPFTTKSPILGIAELSKERRLIVADIPGLIEGASAGAGLGHEFLRHIERTSLLVHVIDVAPVDGADPGGSYRAIRAELAAHSGALADKPEIIVLNKIDLVPEPDRAAVIQQLKADLAAADDKTVLVMSGATGEGVPELLDTCWHLLARSEPAGWRMGV